MDRVTAVHYGLKMASKGDRIMNTTLETTPCSKCGETITGIFKGDICPDCALPFWKCTECKFIITAKSPPDVCPECGAYCSFIDATCYEPDCGGSGKLDPRI